MSVSISRYWEIIKNFGVEEQDSIQEKRLKWFFNIITVIGALTSIPQIISALEIDSIAAICHTIWGVACFVSLFIHAKINFKTARFMLFLFVFVFGSIASLRVGSDYYPHIGSFGIVTTCFILHDIKKEWGYVAFFMLLELAMLIGVESNYFRADHDPIAPPHFYKVFIIIGTMLFVMIQVVYYTKISVANEKLINEELRASNLDLKHSSDENIVLLKEIHLLRLQAAELSDEDSLDKFTASINRVKTISALHELVYSSDNLQRINIEKYIRLIAQNLISSYNLDKDISLKITSDLENAQNDSFMPVGLILNELISNSLKHGFHNTENCIIKVDITRTSDKGFKLIYQDNGNWKIQDEGYSFGSELVQTLAEQINGQITRDTSLNYSYYTLDFQANDFE